MATSSLRVGLIVGSVLLGGCALWPTSDSSPPGPGRESAETLPLEAWQPGSLHCEAGECIRWHRLTLEAPGELQVEVHAASGDDVPDFDLRLEDPEGEILWGFAPTGVTPRKIERLLSPGDYYLVVESVGELRGGLDYEAFAKLEPIAPVFDAGESGERASRPRRLPRRSEVWMSAEILQLEGRAGLPSLVVLAGGTRDDWQLGHAGELIEEGGRVIATFVLIEVGEDESRGRLDAPPVDVITYEARARVRVPLE